MKKFAFLFLIGSVVCIKSSHSEDVWIQKADFPGLKRGYAVAFSIGNKGYLGTGGKGGLSRKRDFWEYDPATDTWTQKATFGGVARKFAAGFSIGSKGYIGTGQDVDFMPLKDFWEYDSYTNTWVQKADFPGAARYSATSFSIGTKGYIGLGSYSIYYNDFWEFDPVTNLWTQKADFTGTSRYYTASFTIGNKAYMGTGYRFPQSFNDFWEYDPVTNIWTQRANVGGPLRWGAIGFSIANKGYVGTGYSSSSTDYLKDCWEYEPATNTWEQKTDLTGIKRSGAVGFSIGNYGYVGTGFSGNLAIVDFWQYIPDTALCVPPGNLLALDISPTEAKLKWDSVPRAEKYKLRYKVANTNDWIILNPVTHHKKITGLLPNTTYVWQIRTYCKVDSPNILSDWSSKQEFTTLQLRLSEELSRQPSFQLYPNPAEDHATIQFTLAQSSHIYMSVFDETGKKIKTVLNDDVDQGNHTLQLILKDFPEGIYFVKMISDFGSDTQKLLVQ